MNDPLIRKHGGYRNLKSFQVAQLVYDVTVRFCDRYISKRSRTRDQMVQAARDIPMKPPILALAALAVLVGAIPQAAGDTAIVPAESFTPSGPPLADGKPKFLGGVSSPNQDPYFLAYWNQVTPENAGKWGSVESTRDVMNWTQLDTAYQLAKANGLPFRFHVLVWGNQQPAWIESLPAGEQLGEIEEWFEAVAARYPDIDYLEVVNEPLHDPPDGPGEGNYMNALGGSGATGWDWVINAFRLARQKFPVSTKLVLNEYSVINDGFQMGRYIQIINLLKAESLVDVVAEQAHSFTVATTSPSTMAANLNTRAATGLPIMITEMDIDGADATTAGDALQLSRYQTVFPVLWEHPAVIGITMWGYRPGLWRPNAVLALADNTERAALQWMRTYVAASDPPLIPLTAAPPSPVTRNSGQPASFTAAFSGNPAPSIRWRRSTDGGSSWADVTDDATFSGSTTGTLAIAAVTKPMSGHRFHAVATNASGAATSAAATLTVLEPPAIAQQPVDATAAAGGGAELSVAATGSGPFVYQWRLDGVDIPGANADTLSIPCAQLFHAGTYTVAVSNADGTTVSASATITVEPAPLSDARPLNLSTRALCQTGDNVLIPGFVISGAGTKRMLVRAVGPTLAEHGITDPLPDPVMSAEIVSASEELGAFELLAGSNDAALLLDLSPGQFTVVANDKAGATGVAIVELYDADQQATDSRLINISNRGFVGAGDSIMIPGFVVSEEGSRTFLIRASRRAARTPPLLSLCRPDPTPSKPAARTAARASPSSRSTSSSSSSLV